MAVVDYFLKIDGIGGESQDSQHKGEIELISFSWGASNSAAAAHATGGGAGRVAMQDFHFVAKTSQASPRLMLALTTAHPIKEATLTARKAGSSINFIKLKLTDLLVSSYQIGTLDPPSDRPSPGELNPPSDRPSAGASDPPPEAPRDAVSLNFTRVEFEVTPASADGAIGQVVKGVVDARAGR